MNKIQVKVQYNLIALMGWAGVAVGLVGAVAQYLSPSMPGFVFLTIGLIGGGITVTLADPLRRVMVRTISVQDSTVNKTDL
ncbi:hypothetical protein [Achromobacter spanius]|uniref:hypothetical protein n=1 Tax=Achromobacter spanius TaxID=217203 RepID=UPI0038231934